MKQESSAALLLGLTLFGVPGLLAQSKGGAPTRAPAAPTAPTRSPAPVSPTGTTYPAGSSGNVNYPMRQPYDYDTLSDDLGLARRELLQNREHELLLAHRARVLDLDFFCEAEKLRGCLGLQVFKFDFPHRGTLSCMERPGF